MVIIKLLLYVSKSNSFPSQNASNLMFNGMDTRRIYRGDLLILTLFFCHLDVSRKLPFHFFLEFEDERLEFFMCLLFL